MKILLVDDDPDLLDVTSYALERAGFRVSMATDGQQAVERCAAERPDLVVLDVNLPRLNGFEACRRIRAQSLVPVVLLTARNDDDSVVQGFLLGADDYVTKPFSHRQLAARLRAILNRTAGGLAPEPDGELVAGPLRLDARSHEATVGGQRSVRLTPLEFKVLRVLALNAGRVVPTDRIVERAWGYEGGDVTMVKTHVSHIRRKLAIAPDEPGYIRTVPWVGYALLAG